MSTIYFVSFLFLFFSNFHPLLCEPDSSDFKKCEAEGVTITNFTSGVISLPIASNATCSWILDFSAVQGRVAAFLLLETIKLESGDSLVISSLDAKNASSLLLNLTHSVSNNLFFTGTTKNLMINLTTNADSGSSRSFHLFLETRKKSAPISILGDTVLTFLKHDGKPDEPQVDYTFKLALSANQNMKKIAASVDKLTSDITVTFDAPWTDNSPDFLSSNDTINMILTIKDISSGTSILTISVYSVADACSQHVSLTEKNSRTTVEMNSTALVSLIDVKCLWIIESDDSKNLNIKFNSDSFDFAAGNSFVIRKGNRKSSPVLYVISSTNFNDIRSNIYNSILNSSSLYITYEAFELNGEHPHFDVIRPAVKNYIDGDTTLNLDPFNMPTKFLFKAKPGNVAVLSTTVAGQTFSNTTNVFDQPILSPNNLLAVFNVNDTFPEYLWSDSDLLVVDFSSLSKKMSIQFKSQPSNLGSTARQSSGSLVLFSDHLDCKSSYNWFIPPRHSALNDDVKIVKSLIISSLALEKGGSMTLTSFAPTKNPHQYTITGENAMSRSLPPFYLDASISHSIEYTRPDKCDKNSITLIQASIDTISYDACANIVVTAEQDFVSCNYPNYYPLTEWTMSKNCRHMNSSSPNIYIKFIDVDLVNGHSLEFLGPSGTNINLTLSNIPGDKIVSNEVAINFDRVFNAEEKTSKTLNDQLSGRGFKTILEPIECGGMNLNKTGSLSINGTDKPQKCIWIIQTPLDKDPKTINLLNFTLSDSLKGAKVYDSDSRKNNRTVNISGAGYYNSTTETIIVEFTTSSTPAQISWSTLVCSDPCLGTRRCINPSERCNGVNDCGDWSDELHCNGTAPVPPEPKIVKSGVSGLVVVFVIIPLSIIFGVVATIMAPRIMARIRGGQYTEFREYSDVS